MTDYNIINSQIRNGIWEAELVGGSDAPPAFTISHQDQAIEGIAWTKDASRDVWRVKAPIPPAMINDGLQTLVVCDDRGNMLTSFSLLAGDALAGDLRAEIELLRSELEILKKAFRAHCAEN